MTFSCINKSFHISLFSLLCCHLLACGGAQPDGSSSSANVSSIASQQSSSTDSSTSSELSSSPSTSSSASSENPNAGPLSDACLNLVSNTDINWDEANLGSEHETVKCLYDSLGRSVGYGEESLGGYDPTGNSQLVVIRRNTDQLPEQQLYDAINSEQPQWIVFDKEDFASGYDVAMYRLACNEPSVLSALGGASTEECLDHRLWCQNRGISDAVCGETFFNERLNNSDLPIRNVMIKSSTTIDGRGTPVRVLFNGFAIGGDSSGESTYEATNVILTHLQFEGAGHAEDHDLDPDMIRVTGESNRVWIHKNTFKNTGDSAFDVKVGAYNITISFNRLIDVLRASLHGSSDSREINSQIRTSIHNNLFLTTDTFYGGSHRADNTARRVPLLRRGSAHLFNNVFYNYRKNFASVRVGATLMMENNLFLGGTLLKEEKSDLSSSFDEWLAYLTRENFDGGYFTSINTVVSFANDQCQLENTYQGLLPNTIGLPARDLSEDYSSPSREIYSQNLLPADQTLVNYLTQTTGKYGLEPYNSPASLRTSEVVDMSFIPCL